MPSAGGLAVACFMIEPEPGRGAVRRYDARMANIFIYGSCIARDGFEAMDSRHTLAGYVCRQTVISAMSRATSLLQARELPSAFETRMLAGDLASNLRGLLRRNAPSIDLLLMDLTDERLGVHKLPDNSFVSRSHELVSSGTLDALDPKPGTIQIGTPRHRVFWERAATLYVALLEELGMKDKTVVVHTPWTTKTAGGGEVPAYRQFTAEAMNENLQACADHYRGLGLHVEDMPEHLAIADSEHKWGFAQYHYTAPAYDWIAAQAEAKIPSPMHANTLSAMGRGIG